MPIRDSVTSSLSVVDPRRPENFRNRDGIGRAFVWNGPRRKRVPAIEFSLGWELEANKAAARYPSGVELISDGSVNGDSAEYIVMPSVTKNPRYVLGLLKDLVHAPELNTDKSCGFHVHLAPKIENITKLRLWAITCQELAQRIEEKAFKAVPDARQDNSYCRRIQILRHGTRFQSSKYGNDIRYQWLNVVEMFRPGGIRTVEVRLLGNTHRWKYLLAWVTFSLWLGKQAWKIQHGALSMDQAALELAAFLDKIIAEVKPLDKRSEPIPQWVYESLSRNFGIDSTKWERPLQKLCAVECEVTGRRKAWYSDAQATVENDNNGDEDSCECGCGSDGRCNSQLHRDGDCDSNYCEACHNEGNCTARHCESCRNAAHSDGDLCEWENCTNCNIERRRQLELPVNGATPAIANVPEFYGASVVEMINESHSLTAGEMLRRTSREPEGVVIPISADEMTMSLDREVFYNNGGAR